jgi:thiol-disulfide isomerase/thioredoxin
LYSQDKKFGTVLKGSDIAAKGLKYINDNFDKTKTTTLNKVDTGLYVLYKIDYNFNGNVVPAYISADGKWFFGQGPVDMTKNSDGTSTTDTPTAPAGTVVAGNFTQVTDATVCTENGKPIVYFFGSSTCPHCTWEKPVIKAVADLFGDTISYHEKIDDFGTDQSVFAKYDVSGGVPAIVIGCKYYRVGAGENDGATTETANLIKHICDLTGNLPASVCSK